MTNEIAIKTDTEQFVSMIERMATNKDVDVAKLTALLDLQERLMTKKSEVEANEAFARVCHNMPRIKKNGMIDFGKGKPIAYAKWEDVQDAIRPIYEAEGFTLSFDSEPKDGGGLIFHAVLQHYNGHVRRSSIGVPLDTSGGKQNIQGIGSSSSYGQRYATKNLFNLVFEGEDDDGVKGEAVFITLDQAKQINALIDETKTDVTQFLRIFEVAEVMNLQRSQLAPAINMLMAKRKKQNG